MKPYPIILNLENRRVLVVGGGRVAERKVAALLEAGALITVVSPVLDEGLLRLAQQNKIDWIPAFFKENFLDQIGDISLVFGATDNRELNVQLHKLSLERRIPCNIADVPELCTFIVPAVITQGDLLIAVSTGGSSPALARRIREDLQEHFGPEYAEMTRILGELRKDILALGGPSDENKKLFRAIVDSELLTALRNRDEEKIIQILRAILPQGVDPAIGLGSISVSKGS